MFKKAQESLLKWKERIDSGEIIENNRSRLDIDLYPEIEDIELRQRVIDSELQEFNRRGKIMRSENMNKEFTDKPDSFFRYHALRKERMEQWDEIPYEYIATKIKNRNHIVADFGCGENKFKDCLSNKVHSFDHVAFDDTVIACDMKNVPLEDESIDIAMFSLSLWGSNYEDYIKEAYRVLSYGGVIYIAEPSRSYDTSELKDELKSLLVRNGFEIVGDIENRGKFIYIKGLK
jgi:SAM-dependent methyltransferase